MCGHRYFPPHSGSTFTDLSNDSPNSRAVPAISARDSRVRRADRCPVHLVAGEARASLDQPPPCCMLVGHSNRRRWSTRRDAFLQVLRSHVHSSGGNCPGLERTVLTVGHTYCITNGNAREEECFITVDEIDTDDGWLVTSVDGDGRGRGQSLRIDHGQ